MNPTTLACPFCNAQLLAPAATCPRCGEAIAPGASFFPPTDTRPVPAAKNLRVGAIVLGVMLLMAAAGLTYALLTQDRRRDNDKEVASRNRRPIPKPEPRKKRQPLPPATPVAPADLPALGYLPAGTGLIAAAHVHEALTSPAGEELESRSFRVAIAEFKLEDLEGLTGVAHDDLDHVALGLEVGGADRIDAPIHLVARTREKYDRERLLAKLNADEKPTREKTPDGGTREVYAVKVRDAIEGHLWLIDDRTFVVGLFTAKLGGVPEKPAAGMAHLPKELREAVTTRLASGQPIWTAGHAKQWPKTLATLLKGALDGVPLLGRIDDVRTFAVGVVPDKPMKVQGAFRCADEAAAARLEAEELVPRAKKEPEAFKHGREKEWLSVQWRLSPPK